MTFVKSGGLLPSSPSPGAPPLAFDSVTLFFGIEVCVFCVFLENVKSDLRQIFFFRI